MTNPGLDAIANLRLARPLSPSPLPLTTTHNKMVSAWLNKASAALVCALAMSQVAQSLPSSHAVQEAVEEMHFDKLGNMIWPHAEEQKSIPSLGRPTFASLDVQKMESEAVKKSQAWLSKTQDSTFSLLQEAEHSLEDMLHGLEDAVKAVKSELQHTAQDWIHKGEVLIDGMKCESWDVAFADRPNKVC